jgi:uncharacterized repeat protein (TIGR01451 family)
MMKDHASARRRPKSPRNSWKTCATATIAALVLLCGTGLASAQFNKNAALQEMLSVAAQMKTLKAQAGVDAQARATYGTLDARYRELSVALGGDDPGSVLNRSTTAATARASRTKVVPTTPAGCGAATATFTQSTPTAIPTGPAVVTSTVVVSGAGPYLFDLDLTTFITHTFPGDIDMTLTSPAGTVVTITTDNAGTNDDVFNGTVWNDDANPAGQVPYTTNNGMVTDQAYAIGVLASPLTPEEPLAAFIGENPNGTWTITISDDAAGDGGNLASWSLDIDTFGCASADLSITKTDGVANVTAGGMTTYTIVASNAGPTAVNPATVTDTFPAFCTSVSYTSVTAGGATGNTAAGSGNINDAALNLPAGSSVTYTATCTISGGASGTLVNTATISSGTPDPNPANNSATDTDGITVAADLTLTKTASPNSVNIGSNVVFTLTVSNAGPAPATGVTVTDTLPAGLTYVSNDCGAAFAAPTLTWSVGNLAVGASATCHVTATVTQAGPIVNVATATANEGDPTPGNATGTITIAGVAGTPGIPTLSEVGLALLALMLAGMAVFMMKRRQA